MRPASNLTPRQKQLVQESFGSLAPLTERVAEQFYDRLFELEPDLLPLFRGNMRQQGRQMMQILAVVVLGLDYFERLVPVLQDLGRRHVGYGVLPWHYDVVGEALLWTLDQTLASTFTGDTRGAWAAVYELVASTMQSALPASS